MKDLNFLVGEWRGEGRVGEDRVTASVRGTLRDDGALVLDHVTRRAGAADHRERIVVRTHRGRTTAVVKPANGAEQKFTADADGRFVRVDPKVGPMAWEVVADGPDAFAERFVVGEGAAAEAVVTLRHERVKA